MLSSAGANTFTCTCCRVPWCSLHAYTRRRDGVVTTFANADAVRACWLSRAWRCPSCRDCIPARCAARVSDVAAYVFNDALIAVAIARWHDFDCVHAARTSASRMRTLTGPPMTARLFIIFVGCFDALAPTPDTSPWDRRPLRDSSWIVVYAKESTPNDDKDWLACS